MTPAAAALSSALRAFVDEQMIRVRAAFDAAERGDDVTARAWYTLADWAVNEVADSVRPFACPDEWDSAAFTMLHDLTPGMNELSLYVDRHGFVEPYDGASLIACGRLALEVRS